jgi:hypothetical protein
MSTKKKQPTKDTAIEEIDLSVFDMNTIDATPSAKEPLSTPVIEPKKVLSQRERDTFDDHAVSHIDDSGSETEEDPIIKDEFDDDFEDPFDDDAAVEK